LEREVEQNQKNYCSTCILFNNCDYRTCCQDYGVNLLISLVFSVRSTVGNRKRRRCVLVYM